MHFLETAGKGLLTFSGWRRQISEEADRHFQNISFLQLRIAWNLQIDTTHWDIGQRHVGHLFGCINSVPIMCTKVEILTSLLASGRMRALRWLRLSFIRARLLFSISGLRVWKKKKQRAEVSDAFHIFEGNKNGTRVGSLKQPEPFSPFSIHEPLFSELLSF